MNEQPMLYNPPNGADIKGSFGGFDIYLLVGQTRTVPPTAFAVLKTRYPWLHEVVDHPTTSLSLEGKVPSAVVRNKLEPHHLVNDAVPLFSTVHPSVDEAPVEAPVEVPVEAEEDKSVDVSGELQKMGREELKDLLEEKEVEVPKGTRAKTMRKMVNDLLDE